MCLNTASAVEFEFQQNLQCCSARTGLNTASAVEFEFIKKMKRFVELESQYRFRSRI